VEELWGDVWAQVSLSEAACFLLTANLK